MILSQNDSVEFWAVDILLFDNKLAIEIKDKIKSQVYCFSNLLYITRYLVILLVPCFYYSTLF